MKELSKLRQKYGYTQSEMANMLGLHKSTYNQKENGKRRFKSDEMAKLYDFFRHFDSKLNMQDIFL